MPAVCRELEVSEPTYNRWYICRDIFLPSNETATSPRVGSDVPTLFPESGFAAAPNQQCTGFGVGGLAEG